MQKENSYLRNRGIVKIIGGTHKGKFGYYDDDDIDYNNQIKSVIYFGNMLNNSKYYLIKPKYITDDFTIKDLKNEPLKFNTNYGKK